jgi:hypothetical protein
MFVAVYPPIYFGPDPRTKSLKSSDDPMNDIIAAATCVATSTALLTTIGVVGYAFFVAVRQVFTQCKKGAGNG